MKVLFHHIGYNPNTDLHQYWILTANGHADMVFEHELLTQHDADGNLYMELDDRLFGPDSGWADLKCDKCGWEYRERVYPGLEVRCPACDTPEVIPAGAVLEATNMLEDEE